MVSARPDFSGVDGRRGRRRLQLQREVRRRPPAVLPGRTRASSAIGRSSTAAASRTSTSASRRSAGSTTTRWACSPPPRPAADAPTTSAASRARSARRSTSAPPSPAPNARTLENTAVQVQAGGRVGTVPPGGRPTSPHTATAGRPGDGSRERAEIAYRRARWYSGGWADHTDPGFFAADGFLPGRRHRHDRPRRLRRLHAPGRAVVAAQHRRVGVLPGARDPRPAAPARGGQRLHRRQHRRQHPG